MKTLTCDRCDHVVSAETFEEWMNGLKPHYAESHSDVMMSHAAEADGGKAAMMAWMEENQKRFAEATDA